nr:cylicin-1-like [Lytechinus pictus]
MVSDSSTKASLLNKQFSSVFNGNEDITSIPQKGPSPYKSMEPIDVSPAGVYKLLHDLNPHKASGPDMIPARLLKELALELTPIFVHFYQASLNQGTIPEDWKKGNIVPVFKKGDRSLPENYRPVSLTSIVCKTLEHIVCSSFMKHLDLHHTLSDAQHGFRKRRSCVTQLVKFVDDLASTIDRRGQTDAILLDFSKAFDKVPHQRLLYKVGYYGIRDEVHLWLADFLSQRSQRVVIDGATSEPATVLSGVPQGSVVGPLLFLLYINDLPEYVTNGSSVRLFADDCALYHPISSREDAEDLQHDLDALQQWERDLGMTFHPGKCQVASIQPYGAFVKLDGYKKNGLIHKSQISRTKRVEDVAEVLSVGDAVWSKVISLGEDEEKKISLSMKVVNQDNGQDLDPNMVQTKQEEQRKKKGGYVPKPKIELGAVLNTTCKKCGTVGHLTHDCFYTPGEKTYDLIPDIDMGMLKHHQDMPNSKEKGHKHKKKKKKNRRGSSPSDTKYKATRHREEKGKRAIKRTRKELSSSDRSSNDEESNEGEHRNLKRKKDRKKGKNMRNTSTDSTTSDESSEEERRNRKRKKDKKKMKKKRRDTSSESTDEESSKEKRNRKRERADKKKKRRDAYTSSDSSSTDNESSEDERRNRKRMKNRKKSKRGRDFKSSDSDSGESEEHYMYEKGKKRSRSKDSKKGYRASRMKESSKDRRNDREKRQNHGSPDEDKMRRHHTEERTHTRRIHASERRNDQYERPFDKQKERARLNSGAYHSRGGETGGDRRKDGRVDESWSRHQHRQKRRSRERSDK